MTCTKKFGFSPLGLPLREIKYPAVTICSQGLIQDVIDKALEKQFNDYLQSIGKDPATISADELKAAKDSYNKDLYPGATTSPASMVSVLVSNDPTDKIESSKVQMAL